MRFVFIFLTMPLITAFITWRVAGMPQIDVHEKKNDENMKTLSYQSSVNEIIKDLIAAWNSPLVYLKKRGYINPPQMEFENLLSNDITKTKDTKNVGRVARSHEKETQKDLSQLFRSLFSSTDDNICDKIKSKLNVPWDMNALKNSVRAEALKLYEKFYDTPNGPTHKQDESKAATEVERQVAQLYPTVVLPPSKDKVAEEEPNAVSQTDAQVKPKLSGIAKLLTCRSKFMPHASKDQKETTKNISPAI